MSFGSSGLNNSVSGRPVTLRSRSGFYTPHVMFKGLVHIRSGSRFSRRLLYGPVLARLRRSCPVGVVALLPFLFTVLASSPPPTDALTRGLEIYSQNYCGTCHTLSAAHTLGQFGPSHDGLRAIIEARLKDGSYRGQAKDVTAYLRESILEPEAYLAPEFAASRYRMPAFTDLSSQDLEALVALLGQP